MMGSIPNDVRGGLLELFYAVYEKDPDRCGPRGPGVHSACVQRSHPRTGEAPGVTALDAKPLGAMTEAPRRADRGLVLATCEAEP